MSEEDPAPLETPQVAMGRVLIAMGLLMGFLIAVAFGFALFFPDRFSPPEISETQFPNPDVTTDQRAQRLAIEEAGRKALAGDAGRIPIEKAMSLIVARGPHAYDPVESTP